MVKNLVKYYLLYLFLFLSCKAYILLEFNTLPESEPKSFSSYSQFLHYKMNTSFYTELSLGTPPQKNIFFITSDTFALYIFRNYCPKQFNYDLDYITQYSSSYCPIVTFYFDYLSKVNTTKINETYYFRNDIKNAKSILTAHSISMLFSPNNKLKNEAESMTCGNIGLSLKQHGFTDTEFNLLLQLKHLDYIEDYLWHIKYTDKSHKKGYFILGALPHEIEDAEYKDLNEELLRYDSVSTWYSNYWILNFDKVYFTINNNNHLYSDSSDNELNITLDQQKEARLDFNYNVVVGTYDYFEDIKKYFFNELIKKNLCKLEYDDLKYYKSFICNNNEEFKEILKTFPSLKFFNSKLKTIFELNYEDLFLEKDDKYYFLVIFLHGEFVNMFILGDIFTNKYNFIYNYDKKSIGYYIDKKYGKNLNKSKYKSIQIFLLVLLLLIFTGLGFFIGKRLRDKVRKLRANELQENYDYTEYNDKKENLNKDKDKDNINKSNKNVEMSANNKLII